MDKVVELKIDASQAYVEDLEILDGSGDEASGKALLDVLDRIVVGGVRGREPKIPMLKMREIGQRIKEELQAAGDSGN